MDLEQLRGPNDFAIASSSTDTLEAVEECMKVWIKQVQQVLDVTYFEGEIYTIEVVVYYKP